ncbi:MAG: hypothetical protein AAB595_01305 [Patescibacteria group bacterium]
MIMHFLGGFWLGLAIIWFFPSESFRLSLEYPINVVLKILLFILFIGIGWEVFEILVNEVVLKNSFNYLDIISDIFFDLAGGVLAVLYFLKRIMFVKEGEVQLK